MDRQLYVRDAVGAPTRVLLGESVYVDALVTVNHGHLFIEFKDDGIDDIAVDLESFTSPAYDQEELVGRMARAMFADQYPGHSFAKSPLRLEYEKLARLALEAAIALPKKAHDLDPEDYALDDDYAFDDVRADSNTSPTHAPPENA